MLVPLEKSRVVPLTGSSCLELPGVRAVMALDPAHQNGRGGPWSFRRSPFSGISSAAFLGEPVQ